MKTLLATLTFLACSGTVQAGEILRPSPMSDFEWKSTTCPKPVMDMSPIRSKQERLTEYSRAITDHIICLQNEAQSDFQDAQAEMQTAIEEALAAETKRLDEMMKQAYLAAR